MTDQRQDDQAAKHASLPLPSGSYELSDLERIGDLAVKAKPEERDALVAAELKKANGRPDDPDAAAVLPGHEVQELERTLVEGVEQPVPGSKKTETVGAVVVKEQVQVFQPEKAEEEEGAAGEATASTGSPAAAASSAQPAGEGKSG